MKTAKQIRQEFFDFFQSKDHKIVPAAPLVPKDDPTLLFTNAGMNQFKDVFLGAGSRDYTRCVDTQGCIRASGKHNDLDEVGYDTTHHTFFEMLGNWSFGDYFKKEAIQWAWEFLTGPMALDPSRLWASVFGGDETISLGADEEAESLWPELTSLPPEHVIRFGLKDNFWEMGETGPCGPCSEIHYDLGPEACTQKNTKGHVCRVNDDCGRFLEFWNLVFIQYNNLGNYKLETLPARHVDTGLGFARLVAMVQGKLSNYDTDLFTPLFQKLKDLTGHDYEHASEEIRVALRVTADHTRCLCAAIGDGVMPDRKLQGSLLRSVLRRAARFGRQVLGMEEPFLFKLVPVAGDLLAYTVPSVPERLDHIQHVIEEEEESFARTIDRGLSCFADLARATRERNTTVIDGRDAFCLYHQDGFPRDLIDQMAREENLTVDEEGWQTAKTEHENVSRKGGMTGFKIDPAEIEGLPPTEFTGYWEEGLAEQIGTACRSKIVKLIGTTSVVLDRTPFYAEAGGQVGDTGEIKGEGFLFSVADTARIGDIVIHLGELVDGDPAALPASVSAAVSPESRLLTAANHTATHLLHWALKQVLGPDADQQGSYVGPDRLRFDFNHRALVTAEQLEEVERLVNFRVRLAEPVNIEKDDYENARARGVTALFGEKYDERVRVVEIGGSSLELCGGTHVRNTGEIGLFKILSEESVAAGVRRIEALTGKGALDHVRSLEQLVRRSAALLKTRPQELPDRIEALKQREKDLATQIADLKRTLAEGSTQAQALERVVNNITVFAVQAPFGDAKTLREQCDIHRKRIQSGVVLIAGVEDGAVRLVVGVTKDLTQKLHAGKIVGQLAKLVDGKGGGRPDFAQAGGKNPHALPDALQEVFAIVERA